MWKYYVQKAILVDGILGDFLVSIFRISACQVRLNN